MGWNFPLPKFTINISPYPCQKRHLPTVSSSPSCPTTPLPPRALCRIPLGITKAEPQSFVRRHDPRAPQGAASTDTARRRVLLITTSSCFPPAQSGASHGIMDRKTCRTPPPAPQPFMCGHLGMVPSGWDGLGTGPPPRLPPARPGCLAAGTRPSQAD